MIQFKNVKKSYQRGQKVLDGLDLTINDGEFVFIVGNSGAGKTTMMKLLLREEKADSGSLIVNDIDLNRISSFQVPKYRRKLGVVFQDFRLFPNMTVFENVAFGPEIQKMSKSEIRKTVAEMLELVNLKGFEKRQISSLSGGQQQRVAIARALANRPHVLLLDEPLGALDLKLRKDMQKELKAIQKRLGITFIYVTHDQEEALSMSDRVVVMDKGKIQQIGTPEDIYNEPVNAFVADFIGESNIVDAVMIKDYYVRISGVVFDCLDKGFEPNEKVEAVIRPEDIKIHELGTKDTLPGKVTDVVFKGTFFETFVDVGGFIWLVQTTEYHKVGETIGMYIDADSIHVMKRSEYSGEFGDYSCFSDEFDHINDANYDWEAENE